jgi:dTDP-4-dehydrorhamnose 3,5-epimerase
MEIRELDIKGVFEIFLKPIEDERGFFMRTFDSSIFERFKINKNWVQHNHSKSIYSGVIRGLHLQLPPFSEAKLVQCIKGEILDVFVDLRLDSISFGKWDKIVLSEKNKKVLFIPEGFAHGFCTLSDFTEVTYKVNNYYSKMHEVGLLWNDPDIGIDWPDYKYTISEKDKENITLKNFIKNYNGIKI